MHDGIFLKLFGIFTEQFGLGAGKPMKAGASVGAILRPGDQVLNLNYDIAFDLALKQIGRSTCYAPSVDSSEILILKPHGSFNLYVNVSNGNFFFEAPDQIHGSVGIPDPEGGLFFVQDGIVPPRLNKTYKHHPIAAKVLETMRPVRAETVTFWGVGLTDSDVDLLDLYREAVGDAQCVEFINPSVSDHEHASRLLGVNITHFSTLESWLSQAGHQERAE